MKTKDGMRRAWVVPVMLALAGCGGGRIDDISERHEASERRHALNTVTATSLVATSAQHEAIRLHQAFFGMAPGHSTWNQLSADIGTRGAPRVAAEMALQFSALSDADLAVRVLGHLRVTPQTVSAAGSYDTLRTALGQLFAAYGREARGQIILNAATLLGNLKSDVTWGAAARAFAEQVDANLGHSSNPSNTQSALVALQPAGGAGNTSEPAGSADCSPPGEYVPGTRASVRYQSGGRVDEFPTEYRVTGGATFKGEADLIETLVINRASVGGGLMESNTRSYSRVEGQTVKLFGILQSSKSPLIESSFETVYLPPAVERIGPWAQGETRSVTYSATVTGTSTTLINGVPSTSTNVVSGSSSLSYTFLGLERITVPAGVFMACRFKSISTQAEGGAGVALSYEAMFWYSLGPVSILLRSQGPAVTTSTGLTVMPTTELHSAEVNGVPLKGD